MIGANVPRRLASTAAPVAMLLLLAAADAPRREVDAADPGLGRARGVLYLRGAPFTGRVVERRADGSLAGVTPYAAGRRHGTVLAWYAGGAPRHRRRYVRGREDGAHAGWWEDGSRRFAYRFRDGFAEGVAREWLRDGTPYREARYRRGREAGLPRMWWPDGTLRASYVVRDGRRYGLLGSKGCTGDEGKGGDG